MTLGDHSSLSQHCLEAGQFVQFEPYEECASQGSALEYDPEPDECAADAAVNEEGGEAKEGNADAAAEGNADAAHSEEGNADAAAEVNADAAAAGLELLWIIGALPPGRKVPEWLPSRPQAPAGQPSRRYQRLRGAAGYHCSHGGYMAPAARNMRGRPPRAKDCRQRAFSRPQSGSTCPPTSQYAETPTVSEPGGDEPVLPVERGCLRPFSAPSRSHRVVHAFGEVSTTAKDECARPVSAPTTRPVSLAKRPSSTVGSRDARVARPQSAMTARESLATESELGATSRPSSSGVYRKLVEDFSHRRHRNRVVETPIGGQCSLKQRARGHRMRDYGALWNEARGHKFEQLRLGKRKHAVNAQATALDADFPLKGPEEMLLKPESKEHASQKRQSSDVSESEESENELEEEDQAVKMVPSKSLRENLKERYRKSDVVLREEEQKQLSQMAESLSLRLDGICSAPVAADAYRAERPPATREVQSKSVPLSARSYTRPQSNRKSRDRFKSRDAANTVLRLLSK